MKTNGQITARQVRLINGSNEQVGVVPTPEAISMARDVGLDLVEVAPNSDPPVCRIMDYGKFLYEQKRKARENRKKHQHQASLKEVRFRPETSEHDLEIKYKHAREFLEKGHKVQFTMLFKGRQMLHQEKGYEMFDQIVEQMSDLAKVEQPSKMSNRRITMRLMPK